MKNTQISLFTAVLMIVNIMVGTGILIGPGKMAAVAGNASFLSWPLVALLFVPIVLSIVQLSGMFPGPGGFYAYAKNGINRTAGFASGWFYLVGYTFAATVELLALRETVMVSLSSNMPNSFIFNLSAVVICTILNLLSMGFFTRLLSSLTISKLLPLLTLIVLLPFVINPSFSISWAEMGQLPYAFPMTIFGYFGFEYCCGISHLIVDSKRNGPRAILLGFGASMLIYTLFNFGLLNVMGADRLACEGAPAFAKYINLPIPFIVPILSFLIPFAAAMTLFAGANGMMSANALIAHAMAEEKLFVGGSALTKLNRHHRPWVAVLIQSGLVLMLMTLIPQIPVIGGLCNIGILLSFILPLMALLRIRLQSTQRSYYNIALPAVALVIVGGLLAYSVYCLAPTVNERLSYAIPLAVALTLGVFIYNKQVE